MPLVRIVLHCARREKRVSQLIGFERFDLLDRSSWRSVSGNSSLVKLFVKFVSSICFSWSDAGASHLVSYSYSDVCVMDIFQCISDDTSIDVRVIVFETESLSCTHSQNLF